MGQSALQYGGYYFSSTAATDNILDTPIKCAGSTTGQLSNGFTHEADNRIVFDGQDGRAVLVQCSFSASCSGATAAQFHLYLNGNQVKGATVLRTIGAGGDNGAGSLTALVYMIKDDYVELWCTTDASADDITIETGVMTCTVAG